MDRLYYHSGDFDGIASAAIILSEFPNIDLRPINYGENINEKVFSVVNEEDRVFMVDFNLKPIKNLVKLYKQCKSFIWIDHHIDMITEAEKIGFKPEGLQIDGTAACILTWKFVFGDIPIPEGIDLIGKYDVHDYTDPRVIPFQYGLKFNALDPKLKYWKKIFNGDKKFIDTLVNDGIILEKYEKKEHLKNAIERGFEIDVGDFKAFAINGTVSIDNLENFFDSEKYHFLLTFIRFANWWRFRLSTNRRDVNVGEICKRFGGGGHRQSAGFETTDDALVTKLIKNKVIITKTSRE